MNNRPMTIAEKVERTILELRKIKLAYEQNIAMVESNKEINEPTKHEIILNLRAAQTALDIAVDTLEYKLPCDAKLPPALTVKAGVSIATLLLAMEMEGRPVHFGETPIFGIAGERFH